MGVVLALPFTYKLGITPALILLTAMYVTGTYGGAFTAILFRIPGEPIDVPLLWDGYEMAKNGEPAKALGWTLFAALAGGLRGGGRDGGRCRNPWRGIALTFSTPEYFALVLFGLASVVCLGGGSLDQRLHIAADRPAYRHGRCRRHLRHRSLLVRLRHPARRDRVSGRHGRRLRPGRGAVAAGARLHIADAGEGRQASRPSCRRHARSAPSRAPSCAPRCSAS